MWWLFAVIISFTFAPAAVRLITGSESKDVIYNGALYLRVSIPMVPPMAVLVIMRNALQGMRHSIAPLLCSSIELLGKVIFTIWLVPTFGYVAVCACEPVTWVICCAFILGAAFLCRNDFRDEEKDS